MSGNPPRPRTPPPTDEEIARLKRVLLRKGAEVNDKLVALLNGQQIRIEGLLGGKPGEKPIERLRRFLELIDGRLQAIRAGTYGRCQTCGDGLPFSHLEQVPWIDTCQSCSVEAAAAGGSPS